jgi:hypothetical protein
MRFTLPTALMLGLLMTGVAVGSVASQGKPDFSGHWTVIQGRGAFTSPSLTPEFTVTQTETSITISHQTSKSTATYQLNGSESHNQSGDVATTSVASWDGGKLTITTRSINANIRRVLWVDGDGTLVIEHTGSSHQTTTTFYSRDK